MPFCHLRLTAPIPPPQGCRPQELKTLGDHFRKARLERGLLQGQVACELGVSTATLRNWERNRTTVQTRFIAKIVAFLGYDPREETGQFGERIRALRKRQGLS